MLSVEEIQQLSESVAEYTPLSNSHSDFHASAADNRWLFGGNQSGKTFTNMMDLALDALEIHPFRKPSVNGVHWVCIESWEQARDILWLENLYKSLPKWQIVNIRWGQDKVPRRIALRNGHTIEFKAFNQGRKLFEGRGINSCHCDEQTKLDFEGILTEIQARLMAKSGYLAWSMTPIIPQPLLEERINDLPDTDEVFYANLNDNRKSRGGFIPDKRIDKMIADWPEEVQAVRVEGKFASFYGAVYKTFSRRQHVIKPFEIPKDWRRYRGIDFGFTNPFVCLWMTRSPDNVWYLYDEYYRAETVIGEHIDNIKSRSKDEKYVATFADPENAEDRAALAFAGIPTTAASKSIARGIETVQTALKIKDNDKSNLYIFDNCRYSIREMTGYHYPKGGRQNNPKDVPVSKDDHTVDVIRYILHTTEEPQKVGRIFIS